MKIMKGYSRGQAFKYTYWWAMGRARFSSTLTGGQLGGRGAEIGKSGLKNHCFYMFLCMLRLTGQILIVGNLGFGCRATFSILPRYFWHKTSMLLFL